jgi:hypothetical protein
LKKSLQQASDDWHANSRKGNYIEDGSYPSDANDFPFKNLQGLMDQRNLTHHSRAQFSGANRQSRSVDNHHQGNLEEPLYYSDSENEDTL